jgi:hypothetical protein
MTFTQLIIQTTGGPFKPGFGLSGAVLPLDKSLPAARSHFRAVHSDSIFSVPRTTSQQQGPSTPQIIASAMICPGRHDRVEEI